MEVSTNEGQAAVKEAQTEVCQANECEEGPYGGILNKGMPDESRSIETSSTQYSS